MAERQTEEKPKIDKQLVRRGQAGTVYLITAVVSFYAFSGLQNVRQLYSDPRYAEGVVTGFERTTHSQNRATNDHRVVSLEGDMEWVFELSSRTQLADGTELLVLYSAKSPDLARIWKPEYITGGKPSPMRLVWEEERAFSILLLPLLLIASLVMLVRSRRPAL